ncbi:hypothetical protein Pint_16643 [Pistacia integerrima]|uniref:Uncharacterized protein n=1 Tax=Pistacia integerrima TaxID=434235 RepID=A0ACC0ZB12_9ROSI|nr:hypothetical protein Pint_16643 [Pistacia integerrima]
MNWVTFQATCFDFPAVCVNWYDRARGVEIGNKDVKLEYLEEAFTTSNWIVRIYKVKPPNNRW